MRFVKFMPDGSIHQETLSPGHHYVEIHQRREHAKSQPAQQKVPGRVVAKAAQIRSCVQKATRDLLLRWLAFGVFTPLMRNHSAIDTREQECRRA